MKAKVIRISDKKNGHVIVELPDILEEIQNGNLYYWSILYLYSSGDLGENRDIPTFEQQIYESENGFVIDWYDLELLAKKFYQIYDITLIGCKDPNLLHRYDNDAELYEACDIVIEMIDCNYWQIFSKKDDLINKIASKFKDTEIFIP